MSDPKYWVQDATKHESCIDQPSLGIETELNLAHFCSVLSTSGEGVNEESLCELRSISVLSL